jgi:hypothetical protein
LKAQEVEMEQGRAEIRKSIDALEAIKDQAVKDLAVADQTVALMEAGGSVEDAAKPMWLVHFNEAYYMVVAAWQMIAGGSDEGSAKSASGILSVATSRIEQAASELRPLGAKGASLAESIQKEFGICRDLITAQVKPWPEVRITERPRVIQRGESDYELPCSICGECAVSFKMGRDSSGKPCLIYNGIALRTSISDDDAPVVLGLLQQDSLQQNCLPQLHQRLKMDPFLEQGIDAYCPQCDRIFCRVHYNLSEEWDEGFYDCTWGTCPDGHRRIVDD